MFKGPLWVVQGFGNVLGTGLELYKRFGRFLLKLFGTCVVGLIFILAPTTKKRVSAGQEDLHLASWGRGEFLNHLQPLRRCETVPTLMQR